MPALDFQRTSLNATTSDLYAEIAKTHNPTFPLTSPALYRHRCFSPFLLQALCTQCSLHLEAYLIPLTHSTVCDIPHQHVYYCL